MTIRAAALALALLLQTVSPTPVQIDKLKSDIGALIDALLKPNTPPIFTTITVTGPLQAAIDKAPIGSILNLPAGYRDDTPATITKSLGVFGPSTGTRPRLRGGLTILGSSVTVAAIDVWKLQQNNDVVVIAGDDVQLHNVHVQGAPSGQKRGILGNAKRLVLQNVTIDGIQLADQDAQAFACWDGCADVMIQDSFLSAAGETLLIGGDRTTAARIPHNIVVRHSTLTKDLAWKIPGIQVKTTLELKCVDGFLIEDSVIENAWQSAQDGFLITLTPRNQYGDTPFCGVANATIQHNTGGHAAAFANISGRDDPPTISGTLHDVKLLNNTMVDFDPSIWRAGPQWGSTKLIQIGKGPVNLTFDGNNLSGAHFGAFSSGDDGGSAVYFYDLPKLLGFTFTNNTYPKSFYGIFGAEATVGQAWPQYVASGTLMGNTEK